MTNPVHITINDRTFVIAKINERTWQVWDSARTILYSTHYSLAAAVEWCEKEAKK